jgi:predicted RNase H-like nuclease
MLLVLRVRDVAAAERFYRALAPELDVELVQADDAATHNLELRFVVDDLAAVHARAVAAGATVEGEGSYRDPDGNLVTFSARARDLRVAGVDLARGALAVVVLEGDRVVETFRCDSFAEALLVDAAVIGVDVPIGLPESGTREADVAARRFVGPRWSSVFATPIRPVLEAETYAEARALATRLTGKSISAQAYALSRRILELDDRAHDDERVIEVHPEVSFHELARRPLLSKRGTDGLAERRTLLEEAGIDLPATAPRIAEPDLLDATVCAWTARRYARGEALPLPQGHTQRIGAIWR